MLAGPVGHMAPTRDMQAMQVSDQLADVPTHNKKTTHTG